MIDRNVRPNGMPMTETDARELLAKSLLRVCADHGPTRVGAIIGCDEKTVRNARDETTTLKLDTALNLLAIDGEALEPFLERFGRRSVPAGSVCDTDDRAKGSTILAAALALSVALEDGAIDAKEIRQNRATLENARAAIDGLLSRLVRAA